MGASLLALAKSNNVYIKYINGRFDGLTKSIYLCV